MIWVHCCSNGAQSADRTGLGCVDVKQRLPGAERYAAADGGDADVGAGRQRRLHGAPIVHHASDARHAPQLALVPRRFAINRNFSIHKSYINLIYRICSLNYTSNRSTTTATAADWWPSGIGAKATGSIPTMIFFCERKHKRRLRT